MSGRTLAGSPLELPTGTGRAALLVLGFSKEASGAMIPWLSACRSRAEDPSSPVDCYDVRMVQGIPRLVRGIVEKRMRKESPLELQASTLLVYRDNDAWKKRLGVRDPETAHVVVVAASGKVAATFDGPFTDESFRLALRAAEGGPSPPAN